MKVLGKCKNKLVGFAKAEPVFCVALLAALASMIAVPPSSAYAGYIKWDTLALLALFMLCVAGLEKAGVLSACANLLVRGVSKRPKGSTKMLVAGLLALTYASAPFVTNDVALLTFVPFSLVVLKAQGKDALVPLVLALQTIAANAGSYLMPFGNPHNLYTYMLFDVGFGEFVAAQAPFTLVLGLFLAACVLGLLPKGSGFPEGRASYEGCEISEGHGILREKPQVEHLYMEPASDVGCGSADANANQGTHVSKADAAFFAALFVVSVLSVLRVVPVALSLAIVAAAVLAKDRKLFAKIDWILLATFICFFVFSSNLAAIPAVSTLLAGAMEGSSFWVTVGTSQVISNVPACTLLAPFASNWQTLAIGANVGGLGSPIGSMASLITLGFYRRSECGSVGLFLKKYTLLNVVALVVCCFLWVVLRGV